MPPRKRAAPKPEMRPRTPTTLRRTTSSLSGTFDGAVKLRMKDAAALLRSSVELTTSTSRPMRESAEIGTSSLAPDSPVARASTDPSSTSRNPSSPRRRPVSTTTESASPS